MEALVPQWRDLAAGTGLAGVFLSPEWLLPWFEHFDAAQPHVFHAGHGGTLLAILPMARSCCDGRSVLTPAGDPFNDLVDVLLLPGADPTLVHILVDRVAAQTTQVDAALIGPTPTGSRLDDALEAHPRFTMEPIPSPQLALPATWYEFRRSVRKEARKGWERAMGRLLSGHAVSFCWEDDPAAVRERVPAILAARTMAWRTRGKLNLIPAIQTTPAFSQFLAQALGNLAEVGNAALAHLSVDGTPVASDIYLCRGSEALLYQRSFDPAFQSFSPGHLLAVAGVRALIARGVTRLHLGRGDESYKFTLGAGTSQLRVGLWNWFP